jgi:outer membrane receptor protein involved in Fe transport
MKKTVFSRKLLMTAVSATVLLSNQAYTSDASSLDEIIVTAQKREQSIMDIPFAISAFGEEEIKARGAKDIKDLQYSVPGLSITNNLPGQDRVQLRGSSPDIGLGSPTVGRYFDEVSVGSDSLQRALDIPLLDMQRFEVLRGPQGTLYGAGSIGGTIRFITNSPDLNKTSGTLGIGMSSTDGGSNGNEFNGVLNLPIIEGKLAMRIAMSSEDIGGWIDNTATGQSDHNEAERDFVRAKILFQPNDSFNASLMWMNYDFKQDSNNHEYSKSTFVDDTRPPGIPSPPLPPTGGYSLLDDDNRGARSDRSVGTTFATPNSDEWDLFNLILNLEGEGFNIVSSTGYQDRTMDSLTETANAFFPSGFFGQFEVKDSKAEIFTQELRVNSNWDRPLSYTVGAYYRDSDTSLTQTLNGGSTAIDNNSESWAVFGELSYEFSERLTASFGLRHFEEDIKSSTIRLLPTGPSDISPEDQSFDATTPRLNLLWSVSDDVSVYATVSKGFRSGGVNGAGSSIPSFDPEEAMLYEIGGRGQFFDDRVFIDGAIYYMDYDDIQVSIAEAGRARTTNVDSASGPGADLAVGVKVTEDLTFNLTAGYVGREYDKIDASGPAGVAEGDPSQYTPEHTASASLDYRFDWSNSLRGMARVDMSYADGFSVFNRTFSFQPVMETEPLTYLSFRIGAIAESWQVVLSADNLLDEKDRVFPGGAFGLDTYSRPRTLSVKMDYNF